MRRRKEGMKEGKGNGGRGMGSGHGAKDVIMGEGGGHKERYF